MERAVSCGVDRVYFGAETCERMLPDTQQLRAALCVAESNERAFTFVTPFLTDGGLDRVLGLLPDLPPNTEVVCNDWGTLLAVRERSLTPVLGRLLNRVLRGFENEARPPGFWRSHRTLTRTNLDQHRTIELLREYGVTRVELDRVPQGYTFDLPDDIACSAYSPFVFVAAGRKCIYMQQANSRDRMRGNSPCDLACKRLVAWTKMEDSSARVLIAGNAQYIDVVSPQPEWRCVPDREVDISVLVDQWMID
ncbi:hypothetical protein ACFL51_00280 [Myxococcota bacterium]